MVGESGALSEQLGRAVGCHQRGDLEGAARLYRAVLAKAPAQFDALHYLGLLEAQRGNAREAAQWLKRAVGVRPDSDAAQLNLANVLLELGVVEEALNCVNRAVKLNARSAVALNSQGVILLELKRAAEALASFERALALEPGSVEALSNRGNALLQLGRAGEALAGFERALQIDPQAEQVWNNRGNALLELKRYDEAVASYERALQLRPDYAEALHHRGTAHWERHDTAAALADIERALALAPDYAEALNSRGNVLLKLGRVEEALAGFERALQLQPGYVDALSNRGEALLKLGREEEALASCERALALEPGHVPALNNSGNVWLQRGDPKTALALYEKALALQPDYAVALSNRGNALLALRRAGDALASYDHALAIDAKYADALNGRAVALRDLNRHAELAESVEKLFALDPDYPYVLGLLLTSRLYRCDWTDYAANAALITDRVRAGKKTSVPLPFVYVSNSAHDQLLCARTYIDAQHSAVVQQPWQGPRYSHDRIRIAYVSADFHDHPVALLITPLIEGHDRKRFEIIGVSLSAESNSGQHQRLKRAFDQFIYVSDMDDPQVVALLRKLEIDIAVDLMGHTAFARMGIWARRVAPVQVNYLGYPGTSGAEYLDYIVADTCVIPQEHQDDYAERAVYLPDTFMPQEAASLVENREPSRAEQGLPERGVVFCSFNNQPKFSPPVFDIWMRLLRQVEGSVLWLSKGTTQSENNLRAEAGRRGVSAERLVFAGRTEKLEDHLARHCLADLFLDTFPYNAHTTASNALRAGLPVLTCLGNTFASRVAASLLRAVDLPELITSSLKDYEEFALRLAADSALLADYRSRLSQNRTTTPLFDNDRYRRHIEAAYTTILERYQAGLEPEGFAVPVIES